MKRSNMSDIEIEAEINDTCQTLLPKKQSKEEQDYSSESGDEVEAIVEYKKNEVLPPQTKEQKQKQNEEIVISTAGERNGSIYRDITDYYVNEKDDCKVEECKDNGHYFIDASSLIDEPAEYDFVVVKNVEIMKPSNSKLTKFKIGDVPENQEFKTAEFQKEIKVVDARCDSEFKYTNYEEPSTSTYTTDKTFTSLDLNLNSDLYEENDSFSLCSLPKDVLDGKKCFVRSGTFELESEEARKHNERRQGSLVFQNSIQQFSGHNLEADKVMPATPFNSIIHLNDNVTERPLDGIFYEKLEENVSRSETIDSLVSVCETNIKREDSVPIISGGISAEDCVPCQVKDDSLKPTVKTAWVVDMSVPKKQVDNKEPAACKTQNKSGLGFYIDLNNVAPQKEHTITPPKVEIESDVKKNIFSMSIDFEAPKKGMPSRLSQSLCAKKLNPVSSTEMSKSDIKSKKLNGEVENGHVDKSVQLRHTRTSSHSYNRHSWNGPHEYETEQTNHHRTYSLSEKLYLHANDSKIDLTIAEDVAKQPTDTQIVVESVENIEVKPVKSDGFVSLSDLYKPVPKIVTSEQPVYTRMTRSIPETSWIESKLLMSRSIGCRTSSKLLPNMSTSTPSSFCFSHKSSGHDSDEMMSEVSDLSSIQSSTALEISTEETSQSLSSSCQRQQQSANRLGHDLLRMFLEEIGPDVTVEVGGRFLRAHKCILSSRCQYFAAMLSGGWVESAGNLISLQGFSYPAVHFAMCHIYSGAADIPDTIDLVELATLADMLGLEGLKEIVASTLKLKYCHLFHKPCSVCVVGVLECLPLAAAYGLDELYRKALKWITRYFVRVWSTRSFALLSRDLLEKCYQQHVIHMSADNILETTLCVDKLLLTLPNVRWAEVTHELATRLADDCQHYVTQHFSSVLSSASFLSLGKELNWNISKLEAGLLQAAENLAPEQSCRSYSRIHKLRTFLQTSEECWSMNYTELVQNIFTRVENCVVRQAVRVSHTSSWPKLDAVLRARIQELCCLPLEQSHAPRQSRSTSGSRNLDLRQIKIAIQQHSRRTQSTDSRIKKTQTNKSVKVVEPQPPRPRTWPAQAQIKAKIISSSDSSRTSSPAFKKVNKKPELNPIKDKVETVNKPKVISSNFNKPKNDTMVKGRLKKETQPVQKKVNNVQPKTKPVNNILKSNIQKVSQKPQVKSTPLLNKENRTNSAKQSKSGSSSSTQQSPSMLYRNRQANSTSTSTPSSQAKSEGNPYSGSPSLRRSLLLAAKTPQVPLKPVSPATNKRLARIQASNSLTSPTKSSAAKCVNNNARTKVVKQKQNTKPAGKPNDRAPVERSGTFLKDEPTVLNKNTN